MANDYKVRLTRAAGFDTSNVEAVVFDVTPEFSENRSVSYRTVDPMHAPGQIFTFERTSSRTFDITGKFISRSPNEASKTLTYIQYLRSWTMPVFGEAGTEIGENVLGAPPAILFLTAYSNSIIKENVRENDLNYVPVTGQDTKSRIPAYGANIYNVPVVITNLSIPFPSDVDYIPSVNGIPVPTIVNVSISLSETHSPRKYSSFNLQKFKQGILDNF